MLLILISPQGSFVKIFQAKRVQRVGIRGTLLSDNDINFYRLSERNVGNFWLWYCADYTQLLHKLWSMHTRTHTRFHTKEHVPIRIVIGGSKPQSRATLSNIVIQGEVRFKTEAPCLLHDIASVQCFSNVVVETYVVTRVYLADSKLGGSPLSSMNLYTHKRAHTHTPVPPHYVLQIYFESPSRNKILTAGTKYVCLPGVSFWSFGSTSKHIKRKTVHKLAPTQLHFLMSQELKIVYWRRMGATLWYKSASKMYSLNV